MILRAFICAAVVLSAVTFTPSRVARSQPQRRADGEARWGEETLKGLSLRERLGQMLMTPVQVEQATGARLEELKRLLTELGLGGVVVRGRLPVTVPGLFEAGAGIQTKSKADSK
jgi:hypothetical protein